MQNLLLNATGTPVSAGNTNMTVSNGGSSCTFTVTVQSGGGTTPAIYTLGGAGSTCTGVLLSGNYIAGTLMTAGNTAQVDVNVTVTGTYALSTTTINGVTFSGSGSFTTTGAQQVTLTASGNPVSAGVQNFPVTGAGSTCTFPVTFTPPVPAAAFTLSGGPGACTTPVINGNYLATVPLSPTTNTVIIKVDVTTAGAYSITTNTANGMTFAGSGTFTTTGTGINVTLTGAGTPAAAGATTFTPAAGISSCTFNITVAAAPLGTYNCKIDGVPFAFYFNGHAEITDGTDPLLYLDGHTDDPAGPNPEAEFQISIQKNDLTPVGPGTYNVDGIISYLLDISYTDVAGDLWGTSSTIIPPPNPPFTVTVTSVTATRVRGTFSGKLGDIFGGSTTQKTVTEGVFDLPIQ